VQENPLDGIDELEAGRMDDVAGLVARAQDIGRRLNAIPDYQRRLKAMRRHVFQQLRAKGLSYEEIGKLVGNMHRSRVEQIVKGMSGSRKPTPAVEADEPEE
jgi:hypothetical protein